MKRTYHIVIGIVVVLMITCISCKKSAEEIAPGAEVNFFSAAEGIFCFPGFKPLYVDVVDTTLSEQMQFFTRTMTGETFPSLISGGPGPSGTAPVLHVRQSAGTHRFVFMNAKKYVVADTSFNMEAGVKHTFYVYDDPDSLLYHCHVMHIAENKLPDPNESRFRLLHLSSDLGLMNCYFVMEDGSKRFPANLPVNMEYGTHSDFISLPDSVVGKDGNAYLQFFAGTDTTKVKATATIPFRKGRSYAIVVSGLTNLKYVQYKDPVNPGNETIVQLNASIAARVRTIN